MSFRWPADSLLLNPRLLDTKKMLLQRALSPLLKEGYVYLLSSGTESARQGTKVVEISQQAFLVAAAAVNEFFQIGEADVWLNPLPEFHVGGFSVGLRCSLAGAKKVSLDQWSVERFMETCESERVTVSSLVPTQVFDLVALKQQAPKNLRFILVGGGALSESLYLQARQLGWPLLPSYGMTETCAVLAAAPLSSLDATTFPSMSLLPHIRLTPHGDRWSLHSAALYSRFLWVSDSGEVEEVKRPEPFVPDDILHWDGESLKILGRESQLVKVLGETVNLENLSQQLESRWKAPMVVVALPEARRGFSLHLAVEAGSTPAELDQLNSHLMPFEKLSGVYPMATLPRNEMGKINRSAIVQWVDARISGNTQGKA